MHVNMHVRQIQNETEEMRAVAMQSQMELPHGSHGSPKGMEVSAQVQSPSPLVV